MSTSGTTSFKRNRNQVCLLALSKIEKYGNGFTVSSEDMSLVSDTLNMMVKGWVTDGLHLWTKEEGVLHLTPHVAKYSLGNAATDAYVCRLKDELTTKLTGAYVVGATALTVLTTAGMTIGDKIGVVLTDKSLYWTTIATIPTATTLTLAVGLSGAAPDQNLVFSFTNRIYKPLRILDAMLIEGYDGGSSSTQTERFLTMVSHEEYYQLPDKTSNGSSNQVSYLPNRLQGDFYVYPRPTDCSARIQFTYERMIEDLNTLTDDFDFPSEWMEPLVWQLAVRIAPDFQRGDKLQEIGGIATAMLEKLKDWDVEINDVKMVPSRGYYK